LVGFSSDAKLPSEIVGDGVSVEAADPLKVTANCLIMPISSGLVMVMGRTVSMVKWSGCWVVSLVQTVGLRRVRRFLGQERKAQEE
jgi:hypothetical protein